MAHMKYTRTVGQNASEQFEVRVEIEMDSDSETEPNLEVFNSFLTAITGERTAASQAFDGWIAVDDSEE